MSITLPNGLKLETDLKFYSTHLKNRKKQGGALKPCNYIGKLKGDANSLIAATGCSGVKDIKPAKGDDRRKVLPRKDTEMQLTIFSKLTNHSKFGIDRKGRLHESQSDGLRDVLTQSENFQGLPGRARELEILTNDIQLPQKLNFTIGFGYEKSVKEYFEQTHSKDAEKKVEEWIQDIHTQMQAYFLLNSLKTKIKLQVFLSSICLSVM